MTGSLPPTSSPWALIRRVRTQEFTDAEQKPPLDGLPAPYPRTGDREHFQNSLWRYKVSRMHVIQESEEVMGLPRPKFLHAPRHSSSFQKDEEELLEYIDSLLSPDNVRNLPRGDYKELLELSKVILGGTIERKKGYVYKIQRPGADHHARWMAKSIYILKMTLLRHQLDLHWQTKRKVEKMSLFVVFVYLKSWFSAFCLTSAASNDLELFRRIDKFKSVHKKVSAAAANVLQRHTWYLTEELVPLALFNEKLPLDDRTHLALKIGQLPLEELDIRKPSLPSIHLKSELIEYVGVRSTLPFTLVGVPHTFLLLPDWSTSPHYEKMKTALGDLSPLNDSCERALGLVTTINTKMTRDETSFEELIQVVEAHRKKYSNLTKKDLKKFY